MTKPWWKSVTIWGLLATVCGMFVAGLGKGEPLVGLLTDPAIQDAIGQILCIVGIGGAAYGRFRASSPVSILPKKARAEGAAPRTPRVRKPKS